jgi:hypothetical protein
MILTLPYFYRVRFNFLTVKTSSCYSVTALLQGFDVVTRLSLTFPYVLFSSTFTPVPSTSSISILYNQLNSVKRTHLLLSVFKLATADYCYTSYRGLKVKGIGYKFVLTSTNLGCYLFLSAGLSHLTAYRLSRNVSTLRLKKKKRLLLICSTNLNEITNECRAIRNLSVPNIYSGKGLHFYHEKINLKQGKKQSR